MELRHVIKVVVRSEPPARVRSRAAVRARARGLNEGARADVADAPVPAHREIDELLLREVHRAGDELMKASVALHAASAVVLEAVAALHEERENR